MQCNPCKKRSIDRDGGDNGLCFQHKKTVCAVCGDSSAGEELCIDCKYKVESQRRVLVADFRISPNKEEYQSHLSEEALRQARVLAYSSIDSLFSILGLTIQRLESNILKREFDSPRNQMEFLFTDVA